MAGHMHMPRFKEKIIIVFSLLLFFVCVSYLYLSYLQNSYYINSNGERCVSELTSLKYQLNGKYPFHDIRFNKFFIPVKL